MMKSYFKMGTLKIHKLENFCKINTETRWISLVYNGSTLSLVDQQSIRSSHINEITNGHVLQVLGHFTSFRKLGVDILEIHLL